MKSRIRKENDGMITSDRPTNPHPGARLLLQESHLYHMVLRKVLVSAGLQLDHGTRYVVVTWTSREEDLVRTQPRERLTWASRA